jgi:L-serine dehydratase
MSAAVPANDDGLFPPAPKSAISPDIDRRSFMMRNGVIGAAAVMTGVTWTPEARAQQAAKEASQDKKDAGKPKLGDSISPDLDVVKKSKGPVPHVSPWPGWRLGMELTRARPVIWRSRFDLVNDRPT